MILIPNKNNFSWRALGWAIIYFGFFSAFLQIIIFSSGYSGTNGIRDSLLFSSLWLIPILLFPDRVRIIAAVVGIILWGTSLAALCYYLIYGHEFSQSVIFIMFETNTNEASEYLSQYFSLKIALIALAYTTVAVLLCCCVAVDASTLSLYTKAVALCCLFCPALWFDSASNYHEYIYQKQAVWENVG